MGDSQLCKICYVRSKFSDLLLFCRRRDSLSNLACHLHSEELSKLGCSHKLFKWITYLPKPMKIVTSLHRPSSSWKLRFIFFAHQCFYLLEVSPPWTPESCHLDGRGRGRPFCFRQDVSNEQKKHNIYKELLAACHDKRQISENCFAELSFNWIKAPQIWTVLSRLTQPITTQI